jgi:hypothetical protein
MNSIARLTGKQPEQSAQQFFWGSDRRWFFLPMGCFARSEEAWRGVSPGINRYGFQSGISRIDGVNIISNHAI